MNKKASAFQAFLTAHRIDCFTREEMKDELGTVVFRSYIEACGQQLPTAIILDDSIYTVIRVHAATSCVTAENEAGMQKFCNERNRSFKVFKYFLTESGDVCLDACIPSGEEFSPETVYTILTVLVKHFTAEYPAVMRAIWEKK